MNNTEDNTTSILCEQTKLIVGPVQLYIIHGFQTIFGFAALLLNLFALCLLWRVKAFHSNLRLLLCNFSFVLAAYSAAIGVKGFRRLVTPVCDLPISLRLCIMQDWAIAVPLHNSVMSLLTVCLERMYSTIRYRTYDKNGYPIFAIFLLTCSWSATIYLDFFNFGKLPDDSIRLPLCDSSIFGDGKAVAPVFVAFAIMEALSFTSTVCVNMANRVFMKRMAINRAKFDLSARFQVDQNLKLGAALLPSDLLHIICYFPSYAFLFYTLYNLSIQFSTRLWFLHLTYLYRVFFAFGHPLLLITRNPTLRQRVHQTSWGARFMRLWKCGQGGNGKTNDAHMTARQMANAHFEQLAKAWAMVNINTKGPT